VIPLERSSVFGNRLLRQEVKDGWRKLQRKCSEIVLFSIYYKRDRIMENELYGTLTRKIGNSMEKSCMVKPYGREHMEYVGAGRRGVLKPI
jgi:hypothetical protein